MLINVPDEESIYFRPSHYQIGSRATILAKRLRKQALNTIYNIKDPCTEAVTPKPGESENIFKTFHEKLHTQPPSASDDERSDFLPLLDHPSIGTNQNNNPRGDQKGRSIK